ncbi:MAG: Rne/Rng family ribonuclease [Nitrospinaceae bacterium]|nr:MAG: Rne/Rng family ribonuclease [Nitrospinaceae bacterium]
MSKKIMLINADHPEECRAVLLDKGRVEDLIVEHASHEQIKGNIYLGVINRIEPAIEAAFVDIGGKKFGFLPFKDVQKENYLQTGEKKARVRIQDVLARGQKLLVQVAKEGRGNKGPSLTNSLSLPGRFLVLVAGQEASAISRKIEDEAERKKLKEIVAEFNLPENMGLIIRTAGLGRTKTELNRDLQMLLKIWEQIQEAIADPEKQAPYMVYQEPGLVVRTVRDHFTTDTSEIIVDNVQSYRSLKDFMKLLMPRMRNRITLYKETRPLFSVHKVEEQIESIYNRTIQLPSGGSIVIDSAEAMVCIDVNSGKTTSASQLEETALKTNMEAADEIARQLRLRDLGGLVVIDFIDMMQKKNKAQVEKQLKAACKIDKARINISRISKFGLIEMSRQRLSPPVKTGVFETCPRCDGLGHVKSAGALTLQVLRRIQETVGSDRIRVLQVKVDASVLEYMLNWKMDYLMRFQEIHGLKIQFKGEPNLDFSEYGYLVLERKPDEEGGDIKKEAKSPPRESSRRPASSKRPRGRRSSTPKNEAAAEKPAPQKQEAAAEEPAPAAGQDEQESRDAKETQEESQAASPAARKGTSRRGGASRRGTSTRGRRRSSSGGRSRPAAPAADAKPPESGSGGDHEVAVVAITNSEAATPPPPVEDSSL